MLDKLKAFNPTKEIDRMPSSIAGKVAVVTGASRGIGKGIARALGEQGAIVYVTGRTTGDGERTIDTTARMVSEAGGEGRAIRCDHSDDGEIEALFARIGEEAGHIDYLINNVYKIPDPPAWGGGFWDHPIQIWDDQVGIGLRAHYVASWHAAQLLFKGGPGGAIVNVSSPGGQKYHFSCSYGTGKAGLDRLSADMAIELAPKGVAAVALYPGSVSHGVHPGRRRPAGHGPVQLANAAVRWPHGLRPADQRRPDGAHRQHSVGGGLGRGV